MSFMVDYQCLTEGSEFRGGGMEGGGCGGGRMRRLRYIHGSRGEDAGGRKSVSWRGGGRAHGGRQIPIHDAPHDHREANFQAWGQRRGSCAMCPSPRLAGQDCSHTTTTLTTHTQEEMAIRYAARLRLPFHTDSDTLQIPHPPLPPGQSGMSRPPSTPSLDHRLMHMKRD